MHLALRFSAVALAASLVAALSKDDIPADTPVSSLLTSAQSHLLRGETSEALVYYDAAIARDPSDYLTFFKRATTYLSLGRTTQATDDFGKVLQLKPGFEGAHVQLGRIRQRVADWDAAREEYVKAGKNDESPEVAELEEARRAASGAVEAEKAGNWEDCVNQAGVAIMVANRAPTLRSTRSRCRFARGEMEEGMSDLMHVLNMRPGDTSPHVMISATTFYGLGDTEKGIAQIRKCLQSDPDSKVCRKLLKQQKAVEKVIAKVDKAFGKNQPSTGTKNLIPQGEEPGLIQEVRDQVKALKEEGAIPDTAPNRLVAKLLGLACQGYYDMNSKKGKDWCDQALAEDENALYGLLHKAKQLQTDESFEAAIETLKKAAEVHPDKEDIINPLMNDANVKLRRSKTKDYYKVLGVAHDADERQIKSAYRKLSKVHHPDKAAKAGISKEVAEKKMASINEAYEVLSDPELRQRFDQGDDPMSNEQQNPFHQGGGFHQGFGGQQFKFHFGSQGGFPGGGFGF